MRERRQRPRAAEAAAVTARRAPSTHAHCFTPLLLYPRGPPFAERPARLPGLSLPALRMCCRRGSVSLHFVSISFPHLPCVASSGEEAAAAAAAAGAGRAFPFGPGLPEVAAAALASPCPRPLSARLPALLLFPHAGCSGSPLGSPWHGVYVLGISPHCLWRQPCAGCRRWQPAASPLLPCLLLTAGRGSSFLTNAVG